MTRRVITNIILVLLAVCVHTRASAAPPKNVFVSIAPQKYFVRAIGGPLVETTVVVSPGHSPADYEPTPSQMMQMAKADIYFSIGVPFEASWLNKFSGINPSMKVIHTDSGIQKLPISRHEIQAHTDASHDHGAMDPHIWLSPKLVKIQAEHILNGLAAIDPDHRKTYQNNYLKFIEQLDSLDHELKTLLSEDIGQKQFLVFHPSWGYFADAYGLTQISIEIEGKAPKARDVKNLIEFARQNHIQVILVQPQFSTKHA